MPKPSSSSAKPTNFAALCIARIRAFIFYCVSIPCIFGIGIFLLPFVYVLPQRHKNKALCSLLNILFIQLRFFIGLGINIKGRENLPNTPFVALSNHQSPWETFYLFILLNPVSAVMKQSLLMMPGFGWGIAMTKPIPLKRSKPKQALKFLLEQGQQRLTEEKLPVVIFPEGTRMPYGQSGTYSRGGAQLAINAGVPVVFIAHNSGKFWPTGQFDKWAGTVEVKISEPVDSSQYTARELTAMAQAWIEEHIQ